MITALLFDLDGTLFDSSEANVTAYTKAFSDGGLELDVDKYTSNFGLRYNEMMNLLAPDATEETRLYIKGQKASHYKESMQLIRKNEGLLSLLASSKGVFKIALVTTASRPNVNTLLEHFSIPQNTFDVIIAGEDVVNGKPDPECYLKAMTALDVSAGECCIFEDSEVGIAAANAAGAHVVKVSI